jgi:Uma2 family endonuclease
MALRLRDTEHHTYADYLTWSDEQHYELIDGTAYVREPAPLLQHQEVVTELGHQLREALKGTSCRAFVAPVDVRLPKADEADDQVDTVVQPDVLIICDRRKLNRTGVFGAPDWVAEVLSPSTANHDQITKRAVYERAGVRELWLVHPIRRTVAIYRLEAGHYGPAIILEMKGQTPLTAVPGVSIDWSEVLANLE